MTRHKMKQPGKSPRVVALAGLGRLGHMAVKLGKAFGSKIDSFRNEHLQERGSTHSYWSRRVFNCTNIMLFAGRGTLVERIKTV